MGAMGEQIQQLEKGLSSLEDQIKEWSSAQNFPPKSQEEILLLAEELIQKIDALPESPEKAALLGRLEKVLAAFKGLFSIENEQISREEEVPDYFSQEETSFLDLTKAPNISKNSDLISEIDFKNFLDKPDNITTAIEKGKGLEKYTPEAPKKSRGRQKKAAKQETSIETVAGFLSYQIPNQMVLNQFVECTFRIALEREKLLKDVAAEARPDVREIDVAAKMKITLSCPTDKEAFEILLDEGDQGIRKINQHGYTQWIFSVKPLKAGAFRIRINLFVVNDAEDEQLNSYSEEITVVATADVNTQADTFKTLPVSPAQYPEVFFSYAWNDGNSANAQNREEIVDQLYASLQKEGFKVVRDKVDLGYRQLISSFMERIGKGSKIIVVLTEKYARSPYCMFELYEIARNAMHDKQLFRQKVVPVFVSWIDFAKPAVLREYLTYWKGLKEEWENLFAENFSVLSPAQHDRYTKIKLIYNNIAELMDWLADMNTLSPTLLREDDFELVKKAILSDGCE